MNNSTKAKYELAEKMLKGHIDIDEVVLMSGLSKDEVTKLADGLEINNPEVQRLKDTKLSANDQNNAILAKYGEHIDKGIRLAELIKRPNVTYEVIKELDTVAKNMDLPKSTYEQVEILFKYDGYLKRQEAQVDNASKLEKIKIPKDIDYSKMLHISTESRERLEKIRPTTLAQASRIGGVKPADLSVLMVMLEKHLIH